MSELIDEVRDEIEALHAFFVDWFRGTAEESELESRLGAKLHPDFESVQPMGHNLTRAMLLELFAGVRGTNPNFRIEIREPRILGVWPDSGLILAGYVEAQFGARFSIPAENSRRCTALLVKGEKGLRWRHIHETGLPPEI